MADDSNGAATRDIDQIIDDLYTDHIAHQWPVRSFGEDIALIHSELSEALEEHRDAHFTNEIYFSQDKHGHPKPEGIPIELADVFIRLAVLCKQNGISLRAAVHAKATYNKLRPARHGGKTL